MGASVNGGTRLLQARESVRVTLRELCEECGLSRMTLQRIESGEREPVGAEERQILQALQRINERRQSQFRALVHTVGTNCPKTS